MARSKGDHVKTASNYCKYLRTLMIKSAPLLALTALSAMAQGQARLYSWGNNSYLQLGNGTNANRKTPGLAKASAETSALTNITSLAASNQHTLAIRENGTVFA